MTEYYTNLMIFIMHYFLLKRLHDWTSTKTRSSGSGVGGAGSRSASSRERAAEPQQQQLQLAHKYEWAFPEREETLGAAVSFVNFILHLII